MVYRVNRDPIIDNNRTLRVDRMRVGSFSLKIGIQGSTSGYTSGGGTGGPSIPPPITVANTIDKFPFASDADATDVGDRTVAGTRMAGQSSDANGYTSGGYELLVAYHNVIDKFPFSSDANATDVGDMTYTKEYNRGQSSTSNGYNCGGVSPPGIATTNIIEKFPFSSDANAADVGDLALTRYAGVGVSSPENGYYVGGINPVPAGGSPPYAAIQKFSFASDGNSTVGGQLINGAAFNQSGQQSLNNGYVSGLSPSYAAIEKFPFATDADATSVGNLSVTATRQSVNAGQSSTTNGYTSGGDVFPPFIDFTTIDKFPFSTDADATDVGNLTQGRSEATGQQV